MSKRNHGALSPGPASPDIDDVSDAGTELDPRDHVFKKLKLTKKSASSLSDIDDEEVEAIPITPLPSAESATDVPTMSQQEPHNNNDVNMSNNDEPATRATDEQDTSFHQADSAPSTGSVTDVPTKSQQELHNDKDVDMANNNKPKPSATDENDALRHQTDFAPSAGPQPPRKVNEIDNKEPASQTANNVGGTNGAQAATEGTKSTPGSEGGTSPRIKPTPIKDPASTNKSDQEADTKVKDVLDAPNNNPTPEALLQKHWDDLKKACPDIGKRQSPLHRFLSSAKDVDVMSLVLEKSIRCPSILPAACLETSALYEVGRLWIEEVNFVFTGEFRQVDKVDLERERSVLTEFLSQFSQNGVMGSDLVRKISIPAMSSKRNNDFAVYLTNFPNLSELTVGFRAVNVGTPPWDDVEEYAQESGLATVCQTTLSKLTLVKAPSKNPKDFNMDAWLEKLAQHLGSLSDGESNGPGISIDTNDRWGLGDRPKIRKLLKGKKDKKVARSLAEA